MGFPYLELVIFAFGTFIIFLNKLILKKSEKKREKTFLEEPPLYENIIGDFYSQLIGNLKVFNKFNLSFHSKKATIKRVFFIVLFVFLIYFLFFSILPGQEKILLCVKAANDNTCVATSEGDTNPTTCSAYGACGGGPQFNIGTFGDCTGDTNCKSTSCCGDDTGEFVVNETSSTDAPTGYNDKVTACCNLGTDCTYNGYCNSTTNVSSPGIPNKAYCSASIWYGGDYSSTACAAIAGNNRWDLNGEAWSTPNDRCCGDDNSEYNITEISSTDAPSGYNDGITTCCDTSTDCTYDDTCTVTGGASSPARPNKAYCGVSSVWYGGDYSTNACSAIMGGSGYWDIGGETNASICCGDDNNQIKLTRVADSSMDNGYSSNPSDDACCIASTDCVDSSTCFDSGHAYNSVDTDSDQDYCINNQWKDCLNSSQCTGGTVCSLTLNNCVSPDGYIYIKNLGITGIEDISDEYTSVKNVFLELNFTNATTACRYINYDDANNRPSNEAPEWTEWEPCVKSRLWFVSDGSGNKTVYYQIDYSPDRNSTFNDSIYFNFTGAGLDTTPPTIPYIVDGDYTNNNDSVSISWYGASDSESDILGIPLRYSYLVYYFDSTNIMTIDQGITTATTITSTNSTGFNLRNGTVVYVNITVVNSAGLSSNNMSDGITIDLMKPIMQSLLGSFLNLSSNTYQSILSDENTYVYASTVNFSWNGYDSLAGIAAYSYVLTQSQATNPDEIPEGSIGSFANEKAKIFSRLSSGKYYFKIKAKDNAGNWGDVSSINFSIDNTGPTKPLILTETKTGNNLSYTWSVSSDPESLISHYMINLTYTNGAPYKNGTTPGLDYTFANVSQGTYNVTVGAMNRVGIWRWSNQDDIINDVTPPVIIALPNRTLDTSNPVLKAWTDEQAVCSYNYSSGTDDFVYTNTTYHETKIRDLSGGKSYVTITCADNSGNSDHLTINFTIDTVRTPTTISGPTSIGAYENVLKSFDITLYDSSVLLAGVTKDRFKITIDAEETEISVFDLGNGKYNISFMAPEEIGAHTLILYVDSISLMSVTLTVQQLFLSATYQTGGYDVENTTHITHISPGGGILGLASDTDGSYINIVSKQNNLSISNIKLQDNLFIINTRDSSFSNKETLLDEKRFLSTINPSFGYQIDDKYIIRFILRYDNFMLQSEIGNELRKGYYNLLVRNTLSSSGEHIIKFSRVGSENSRSIYQG